MRSRRSRSTSRRRATPSPTSCSDELLAALAAARDDDGVRCVVLASTHDDGLLERRRPRGLRRGRSARDRHAASERFPRLFTLIGRARQAGDLRGRAAMCSRARSGSRWRAISSSPASARRSARRRSTSACSRSWSRALLARNVGRKTCSELLLLGERIDAYEALRVGIVNRVVAPTSLDAAVDEWAAKLASKLAAAHEARQGRAVAHAGHAARASAGFLHAQLTVAPATDDAREGVAAFLERREPRWSGR